MSEFSLGCRGICLVIVLSVNEWKVRFSVAKVAKVAFYKNQSILDLHSGRASPQPSPPYPLTHRPATPPPHPSRASPQNLLQLSLASAQGFPIGSLRCSSADAGVLISVPTSVLCQGQDCAHVAQELLQDLAVCRRLL